MKQTRFLGLAVLVLWAPAALAHTFGAHGAGFMQGVAHPFTGLDHLLAMTAVGVWAAQQGGRALWAVPASFVLTMIIGALVAVASIQLPHIEAMVAASVLVLGLLVAFQSRWPLAAGMGLVSLFAFFHGHAHGLEMPEAASPVLYGFGFVLATVVLHLVGIASARVSGRWVQAAGVFTAAAGAWFMVNAFSI
jgi:urease accessory protein